MRTDHYQGNEIDEQIQRARCALSAGVEVEELINAFVATGVSRDDAFLSVTAAELSLKFQDIMEGNDNGSCDSQG